MPMTLRNGLCPIPLLCLRSSLRLFLRLLLFLKLLGLISDRRSGATLLQPIRTFFPAIQPNGNLFRNNGTSFWKTADRRNGTVETENNLVSSETLNDGGEIATLKL
jgi:hypothetical protein